MADIIVQAQPKFAETDRMKLQENHVPGKRHIVTLCGSTSFYKYFVEASLEETMRGHIVLSIGAATGSDDEHFGHMPPEAYNQIKDNLDKLHYDKIALSDSILVLDYPREVNGFLIPAYIGTSTAAEIAFAVRMGVTVRFRSVELQRREQKAKAGKLNPLERYFMGLD